MTRQTGNARPPRRETRQYTEMTGQTGWFRTPNIWLLLADFLRTASQPVCVWSAACSTGEETYSAAILLERLRIDGHVVASDADAGRVRTAQRGRYRQASVDESPDSSLTNWLIRSGRYWEPRPAVRDRVAGFSVGRLGVDGPPIDRADVVLARNVWRYLSPAQGDRAARDITRVLTGSGRLVIGGSDLMNEQGEDCAHPALAEHFDITEHELILTPRGNADAGDE